MKVKELVELLEASTFVCDCITDEDYETLEEKEFKLDDVGTSKNGYDIWKGCFEVKKGIKTIAIFDDIDELKKDKKIIEMNLQGTKIHLSQFFEHYFGFLNYENNSTLTFYVE